MDYSFNFCEMVKKAGNLNGIIDKTERLKIRVKLFEDNQYKVVRNDDSESFFIPDLQTMYDAIPLEKNESDYQHPYFVFIRERYHTVIQKTAFNFFRSFEQYAFAYLMKIKKSAYWDGNNWIEDKHWF
jgi:hypothetical protein